MGESSRFNERCTRCARLSEHLARVRKQHPEYHCRPVAPFGDPQAALLIVGLAPGKHGANASGRPFTGDHAGVMLYDTLYRYGFSNRAQSRDRNDGLDLIRCRITNAVKCLPPENRPLTSEVVNCNSYLAAELNGLQAGNVVLALGRLAHNAVLRALKLRQSAFRFGHGYRHGLANGIMLVDSYHCSRYNTQTRRLTAAMFDEVFISIRELLRASD